MLRLLTHGISRLGLILASIPIPGPLRTPLWSLVGRALGASLQEAAQPLSTYTSFQAFFTRHLRAGIHADTPAADHWVSPVDALWMSHVGVQADEFVPVKGNPHSLADLLDEPHDPARTATVSTFYLRPKDYHRIHSPFDLQVESLRRIPGLLVPVNRWGQKMSGLFARNERWILKGHSNGLPVYVILVGAMMVGSIRLSHPDLAVNNPFANGPVAIAAGSEIGMFLFGSTVILVADADLPVSRALPAEIRVGEPLIAVP